MSCVCFSCGYVCSPVVVEFQLSTFKMIALTLVYRFLTTMCISRALISAESETGCLNVNLCSRALISSSRLGVD